MRRHQPAVAGRARDGEGGADGEDTWGRRRQGGGHAEEQGRLASGWRRAHHLRGHQARPHRRGAHPRRRRHRQPAGRHKLGGIHTQRAAALRRGRGGWRRRRGRGGGCVRGGLGWPSRRHRRCASRLVAGQARLVVLGGQGALDSSLQRRRRVVLLGRSLNRCSCARRLVSPLLLRMLKRTRRRQRPGLHARNGSSNRGLVRREYRSLGAWGSSSSSGPLRRCATISVAGTAWRHLNRRRVAGSPAVPAGRLCCSCAALPRGHLWLCCHSVGRVRRRFVTPSTALSVAALAAATGFASRRSSMGGVTVADSLPSPRLRPIRGAPVASRLGAGRGNGGRRVRLLPGTPEGVIGGEQLAAALFQSSLPFLLLLRALRRQGRLPRRTQLVSARMRRRPGCRCGLCV